MIEAIREQWALLVIAVATLFGAWTLFTQPAIHDRTSAHEQLVSAIEERDAFSGNAPVAENDQTEERIEELLALRFAKPSLTGKQDRLNELASEAGIRIDRIDPGTRTANLTYGPLILQGSSLQIDAAGSYDGIAAFLSKLGNTPACVIEDFSLRNTGSVGSIDITILIYTTSVVRRSGAVAEGGLFE